MTKHKHRLTPRRRHRRLRLLAIPAAVGAALAGGYAVAAFTVSGTVEADGHVATPTTPSATARIAPLWPGACSDVSVTFANGNDRPVVIDTISGTIVRQPSAADTGTDGGADGGTDAGAAPAMWDAPAQALRGREIPAGGTADLTIPDAVCLAGGVGEEVEGRDVTASVAFTFHIPVGTEYPG